MMLHTRLKHQFVHYIPEHLEPGVLYVSVDYATAVHSCCCGCGQEVVTPLSPTSWKMTFDGETISLSPSIGNRNFECRSHYFIECNRVIEARPWTSEWNVQEGVDDTNRADAPGGWSRIKGWVAKGKRLAKLNLTVGQDGAAKGVSKKRTRRRPDQSSASKK